jgi:hypothetical protein
MWFKKVVFHNFFLAAGVISIIAAIGIIAAKKFLPPVVPLFFGKPSGEEQLASFWFLFLVPAVSILISGLNLFINVRAKELFTKKILAVSSLIISIMSAVTVFKIIILVGFF